MKALLLCAGFGTRLRPLTDSIPKCLVSIHGKPLLKYWLDLLFPEVDRILINTHYLASVVRDFVGADEWSDRIELVHEDELLGTAGTVLRNRAFFGDEAFILAHADNLTRFNLQAFIAAHRNRAEGIEITMMTFDTDSPQSCGIIELDVQHRVIAFHEKVANPPGRRANGAVYICEPAVVDFIASLGREVVDLSTEVLPHFLGRMQCFHNADYHRDIGTPESLRLAHAEFGPA